MAAAIRLNEQHSCSFDHLNQREFLNLSIDLILQPLALILLPALSKSILLVANNSQQFNMELLRTLGYWPSGVFIGRIYVETSC